MVCKRITLPKSVFLKCYHLFPQAWVRLASSDCLTSFQAEEDARWHSKKHARKKTYDAVVQVDLIEQAQRAKLSVLAPIYSLAEKLSFPACHWLAFALMATGVVSLALQGVLGKFVVLSKFSLSPTEILSDAFSLAVSFIGLVLTTQAATENSTFTFGALAVLSATTVGGMLGLVFYRWGQRQELQAVEGRRRVSVSGPAATDERA